MCLQVFSFPIASPPSSLVRDDLDPITHLSLCLDYQRHWCEHKPSVTISVKDDKWAEVGDWVYRNFDELAGVSFLPYDTGSYQQTPYESVDEEQYLTLLAKMPKNLDWAGFQVVERGKRDYAVGRDLACSVGGCESVGEDEADREAPT
jgi:ribonucleoside-triphosphate reductase (thioredoxin)